MTGPLCTCGRPITDNAVICHHCGAELRQALLDVRDELAAELDTSLARQARIGAGGGRTDSPLAYGAAASVTIAALRRLLLRWVQVLHVDEARPAAGPVCHACLHPSCRRLRTQGLPETALAAMAGWLAIRVQELRRHPMAATALHEITNAVRDAQHVIDRPADRVYCGPCGRRLDDGTRCTHDLYARPGAALITCRCGKIWDIRRRRDWLLAEAEDVLGTATEIARAVTTLAGETITRDRIWKWHSRGRLQARGSSAEGHPLYRVGDVLDLAHGSATTEQKGSPA